ncbi:MAG: hypothetical protein ACODAG_08065, partial [Myxococcota bacterium]
MQASDDGTADEPFSGIAMPPSYCVAARELPELPPQKCVYPDGTEVITGPPEELCPGPEGPCACMVLDPRATLAGA